MIGDALTYHLLGGNIADGKGFERALHPQPAPFEGWSRGSRPPSTRRCFRS